MPIYDSPAEHPILGAKSLQSTPIYDLVEETFSFGKNGQTLTRAFLKHLSAVAVLAMDEQDRVLLIRQYRHPLRQNMWEIPAGLLDAEGEPMLDAAARELHEEADISADTWHTLADFHTSPGASNEGIRIYLARGITETPEHDQHEREGEEAEIEKAWIPLTEAVQAVLTGQIRNPSAVTGVLALHAIRTGAGELRDPRAPWTDHPRGIKP
ncbi:MULTISPECIES: NUDIX domain-containing protein [unclassified Nesterenkonia]|uniref:NUDIX domain-containing protein n=1 Tax=unclassified Nesterenkonia TaxID=2629769 RepID=UPI001F4C913F|nr:MULTISPECIES: NUDIX hydrolase [unclassified Nesterenkonia]MCH8559639.1 NUDIX hydrolase [Nesterenkonia sp. DZ6]MCH8561818.1 NUDIX hydrolase [Nesterenkonia sp. YGD6]MCH8570274.1 NUDIX hydrolase [Nesterenkonia sp. AY15]